MKRKNNDTRYCVVCRTRSDGAGITFEDSIHICFDCAEMIYKVMDQWHKSHLDRCNCAQCRKDTGIGADEIEF